MNIIQAINRDEARDQAIEWQSWQSTQNLSYEEMLRWQEYFTYIADKYDLFEEFEENGII